MYRTLYEIDITIIDSSDHTYSPSSSGVSESVDEFKEQDDGPVITVELRRL